MQFDFPLIDPEVTTGTDLAAELNSWVPAIESSHSGAVRPTYAAEGLLWLDKSGGAANWALKLYDGADDITIARIDSTANTIIGGAGVYTSLVSPSLSSVAGLTLNAVGAGILQIGGASTYKWDAAKFSPVLDNAVNLGDPALRWKNGNFSTSVVTPVVGAAAGSGLTLQANGANQWQIQAAGHLLTMAGDNVLDIGAAASNRPRTGYFGTAVVTPLLSVSGSVVTPVLDLAAQIRFSQADGTSARLLISDPNNPGNVALRVIPIGNTGLSVDVVLGNSSAVEKVLQFQANGGRTTFGFGSGDDGVTALQTTSFKAAGSANLGGAVGTRGAELEIVRNSAYNAEGAGINLCTSPSGTVGEIALLVNTDKANAVAAIQALVPATGTATLTLNPAGGPVRVGNIAGGMSMVNGGIDSGTAGPLSLLAKGANVLQLANSGGGTDINWWTMQSNILGADPLLYAFGSGVNVNALFSTKAAGFHGFYSHGFAALQFAVNPVTSADRHIYVQGGTAGADAAFGATAGNIAFNSPVKFNAGSTGLSTLPAFESAEQAIVFATVVTVAHGLAAAPKNVVGVLRCKTAELGYAVGDEINLHYYSSSTNGNLNFSVFANATNIGFVTVSSPGSVRIARRDASGGGPGNDGNITFANWRVVLRAW